MTRNVDNTNVSLLIGYVVFFGGWGWGGTGSKFKYRCFEMLDSVKPLLCLLQNMVKGSRNVCGKKREKKKPLVFRRSWL